MMATLKKESEELVVDPSSQMHLRSSASVDFGIKQKSLSEHRGEVVSESSQISQKDLRSDRERLPYEIDHVVPYRSSDSSLLKSLNEHTL